MTDKERLEDIKLKFNNTIDIMLYVPYEDVKFLIEQAKRVQELEELVEGYKIELMIKDNAKKRAKQRSKHYQEALNNIITLWTSSTDATDDTWLAHKMSEVARQALEGEE